MFSPDADQWIKGRSPLSFTLFASNVELIQRNELHIRAFVQTSPRSLGLLHSVWAQNYDASQIESLSKTPLCPRLSRPIA